jgi:uncharacterized protein YmfQ (DUF2313 family)
MGVLYDATGDDVVRALRDNGPTGIVWTGDTGSRYYRLLQGIAAELVRFHNRCNDMIDEALPDTTSEQLADWERVLALPDPYQALAIGTADADRREALTNRLAMYGGANVAYWVAMAAKFNVTVAIAETLSPFVWSVTGAEWTRMTCASDCDASILEATDLGNYIRYLFERFKPAHTFIFWTD